MSASSHLFRLTLGRGSFGEMRHTRRRSIESGKDPSCIMTAPQNHAWKVHAAKLSMGEVQDCTEQHDVQGNHRNNVPASTDDKHSESLTVCVHRQSPRESGGGSDAEPAARVGGSIASRRAPHCAYQTISAQMHAQLHSSPLLASAPRACTASSIGASSSLPCPLRRGGKDSPAAIQPLRLRSSATYRGHMS